MEKESSENSYKIRSAKASVVDGIKLFTDHFKQIFKATWPFMLTFAIVSGVIEALFVAKYPVVTLALMLLWLAIYFFLVRRRLTLLPPAQSTPAVYMRHFGQISLVALLALLICVSLWILASIPAVILVIANVQAEAGMVYGDPSGMPDYMLWLTMAVYTIANIVRFYVYLVFFFPIRFAKNSAIAYENERQQALHKIQTNS